MKYVRFCHGKHYLKIETLKFELLHLSISKPHSSFEVAVHISFCGLKYERLTVHTRTADLNGELYL